LFSLVARSAATRRRRVVKAAGCQEQRHSQGDGVRVSTALNTLLALPGASVTGVRVTGEGVIVRVRLRRRRMACSVCGQVYSAMHDRALRRWRHLDMAGHRCFLEYELRRVACRACGVRVEAVPWARAGARHTREFEELVAFCAQRMAKSHVQALLRIAWATVGRIITRVVADGLDERRLDGLVWIGVDEIAYRRGHRFLTNVVDHRTGGIVWSAPGRTGRTLQQFFALLGERTTSIRAVSIDMSEPYAGTIRRALPAAEIAFDPFHVIAQASRAVDQVRRDHARSMGASLDVGGTWIKHARFALLKAAEHLNDTQRQTLAGIQATNRSLYRAYLLKEQLRALYQLPDPAHARAHLDAWLAWAARSQLEPFVKLARTLRRYREGILAAIDLGLTNARLEGLHNKIRLLCHRSYGLHSSHALIALIYLCCSGITITPPLR
jgi:transposase